MEKLITLYISNQLEGKALQEFEERLSKDVELKKEVDQQAALLETALENGIQEYGQLEDRLKRIHANVVQSENPNVAAETTTKKSTFKIVRWAMAAAAVLLLAILATQYIGSSTSFNNENVFANYAPHKEISLTSMSTTTNVLPEAEALYNAQNYAEAIPLFTTYLKDQATDVQVILYRGISYMNTDKYNQAIADFKTVEKSNASFNGEGTWYQALVYLKKNDLVNCKQTLQVITKNPNAIRNADALKLLKDLAK